MISIYKFQISQATAPTQGVDPVQQFSIPPPPPGRPLSAYDVLPPDDSSKKMEIETVKEIVKKEPGLAERVMSLKNNGIGFDVDFVVGSTSNAIVSNFLDLNFSF